MTKENQKPDYDSPWKDIIEIYFPQFLEFFFPKVYDEIDWSLPQPYEFLNQELQQLEADAKIGKRLADKVVKVWLKNGEQIWIIIHLEVQGKYEKIFPNRMWTYHYRLYDRHQQKVVSLAILADDNPHWRPNKFTYEMAGCQVSLEFPIVKLLDFADRWEYLEQSTNPFAIVVMAHLKTIETKKKPQARYNWKVTLFRSLYERGFKRKELIDLYRFLDWIMTLPEGLEIDFKTEVTKQEASRNMRYVTNIERFGIQEGALKTNRKNTIEVLEIRFNNIPEYLREKINSLNNVSILERLHRQAILIESIPAFEEFLEQVLTEETN